LGITSKIEDDQGNRLKSGQTQKLSLRNGHQTAAQQTQKLTHWLENHSTKWVSIKQQRQW